MKAMKLQITIEYFQLIVFLLMIITVIIVALFYYNSSLSSGIKTAQYPILNFEITNFNSNTVSCGLNFSFQVESQFTSPLPIKLEIGSPSNNVYFININSTDYTYQSYQTVSGQYQYSYATTNYDFNETICNLFTTVILPSTGTLEGVYASSNGKFLLYPLSNEQKALVP